MTSRILSLVLIPLLACAALTGCHTSRTAPLVAATAPPAGSPASPTAVGTGAGGPGSLTVAITSPVAVQGHVDVAVACTTTARKYVAQVNSATIEGVTVSFIVTVLRYTGPGTYSSTVDMTVVQAGTTTSLIVPAQVQLTDAGGTYSLSASGSGGRTVAATLTWACGA